MLIVIVDDEMNALQLFLSDIVGKDSFDYRFFKDDPESIIDYVKNNDVAGAFLDINMPAMNGIDLAKKLLDVKRDLKIIFLTGTDTRIEDIPEEIKPHVIDIIYKPYKVIDIDNAIASIKKEKTVMEVKMFGSFDCFINHRIVPFSSSKSKELFALLLAFNGKSLSMGEAITFLWPDKDIDKAKILYRDAVWRLRNALEEVKFSCVDFQRALLILDKKNIECDYYDFLQGKEGYYGDSFLTSYEWSIEFESEIHYLSQARPKK